MAIVCLLTAAVLLNNVVVSQIHGINHFSTPDPDVANYVDELQDDLFCPFVTTCIHSYSASLVGATDEDNQQCCRPCQCGQQCDRMQCCSDIMPCTNATIDHNDQPLVCIRPNVLRNLYSIPMPGFMAIASCKPDSDEDEQAQCLQRYDMRTADVYDVLPVSDVTNQRVYRNIHCALCNGIFIDNTKYWLLHVNCEYTSNIDLTQSSTLLKAVWGTFGCDAHFSNPFPETAVKRCTYVIDRCNVTGLYNDTKYDPDNDRTCHSGPDFAEKESMIMYAGCEACNGFDKGQSDDFPFETHSSLSVTLALDSRTKITLVDAHTCRPGMIYHKGRRVCLEARCSLLRRLRGDQCEKIINSVENWTYRLGFRFKPKSRITIETGFDITSQIIEKLRGHLELVFGTLPRIIFEIVLVSDVDYKEGRSTVDLFESDVIWYEIRVLIHIGGLHDPEDKLNSFLAHMTPIKINITSDENSVTFDILVKDDSGSFTEDKTATFGLGELCSSTLTNTRPCLGSKDVPDLPFKVRYPTNCTAVPFIGYNMIEAEDPFHDISIAMERNILEFRGCPYIKVYQQDKVWNETDNGLDFSDTGISLNSSEFVFGENAEEIWICLDKYNSLFKSCSTCMHYSGSVFVMNALIVIIIKLQK